MAEDQQKLKQKIGDLMRELALAGMNPIAANSTISFDYGGLNVSLEARDDFELLSTLLCIDGTFCSDRYKLLKADGRKAVDVGTNIGDSAIRLALDGASHVYSFEPYPLMYEKAVRNVKANGLEERITVVNKGCGKDGAVKIDPSYESMLYTPIKNFERGDEIETLSLRSVIDRYQIPVGSVLSSNCEGCEYELIMEASERDLSTFSSMLIEYHYGPEGLAKKLDGSSFNVAYVEPEYFRNPHAERSDMQRGPMFAVFVPKEYADQKRDITVVPRSS